MKKAGVTGKEDGFSSWVLFVLHRHKEEREQDPHRLLAIPPNENVNGMFEESRELPPCLSDQICARGSGKLAILIRTTHEARSVSKGSVSARRKRKWCVFNWNASILNYPALL